VIVFDCGCKWRFIVGKKQVYGPIWRIELPGHFTGRHGCYTLGRMMSREQFADEYADCEYRFQFQERGPRG
jgi:hypothetical protein